MSLVITTYDPLKDEEALFRLLEMEGAEWQDYWSSEGKKNYRQALRHSHTYACIIIGKLQPARLKGQK